MLGFGDIKLLRHNPAQRFVHGCQNVSNNELMVFIPFLKNALKLKQVSEVTVNSTDNAFLDFPKATICQSTHGLYMLYYV